MKYKVQKSLKLSLRHTSKNILLLQDPAVPGGLSAWSYAQSRGKAMYTTVNTSTFYLLYFSDIKIRKSAIAQFIAFRLDLHLTLQTRCT